MKQNKKIKFVPLCDKKTFYFSLIVSLLVVTVFYFVELFFPFNEAPFLAFVLYLPISFTISLIATDEEDQPGVSKKGLCYGFTIGLIITTFIVYPLLNGV